MVNFRLCQGGVSVSLINHLAYYFNSRRLFARASISVVVVVFAAVRIIDDVLRRCVRPDY